MFSGKILIVGSDKVWSIEKPYLKYLKELGVEAQIYAAQNIFYDYYDQSVANKMFFRLGISTVYKKINRLLLQKVSEYRPEIIWIFKGMEIFPETIQLLKNEGCRVISYNPDNPFIFSGYGSGNKNVTHSISLYDLHFTYNLEVEKKLVDMGCHTVYLPFGFDLENGLYEQCCLQQETVKVCFIGNPDAQRANFITQLAAKGIDIDLYGHQWKKFVDHPRINVFPALFGDEYWKVLRRYRVQLNLMRLHNENSHNMRSFEIPGVGGIMLAPDTTEHRLFFTNNEEVFLFTDTGDCAVRIKELISLSAEQAGLIRTKARTRSLNSGYTYKHRTQEALQVLEQVYA
jgi:spore maturation protein CgeB